MTSPQQHQNANLPTRMMPNEPRPPLTAVIVPYFQRERGLLRKCVESVLAQEAAGEFKLIIVDDESPISAAEELDGLHPGEDPRVQIIRQKNAGPGAARNKGLDHLPQGTEYVAFIDSDDWWEPDFLSTAVAALGQDYDIFFANSKRYGFDENRFDWHAANNLRLIPSDHQLIDDARALYAFRGHFFDYALVRSNIISTSALAYRHAKFPALRFSTKLFNGQDRLFKLHLSKQTEKVAFCPRILVDEGTGINIYDSAKWGSAKSLRLLTNYIRLSKTILAELALSPAQRDTVLQQLNDSRLSLTASLLHLLKTRKTIDWKLLRRAVTEDPPLLLQFIPNTVRIVRQRMRPSNDGTSHP